MTTETAACGHPLCWLGCYSGQYDLWTPESYAHPAKMAPALCFRIFEHLEELGLLNEGDTVLDMMAGIGTTLLVGAMKSYRTISVELEEKFVMLARQNMERLGQKHDIPPWQIIQGDARRLSELLEEQGLVAVTSPPYQDTLQDQKPLSERQDKTAKILRSRRPNTYDTTGIGSAGRGYGFTPGQIGALPDKPLKAVVSPPYANEARLTRQFTDASIGNGALNYGETEGQIGQLPDRPLKAITSPPYEDAISSGRHGIDLAKIEKTVGPYSQLQNGMLQYSQSEGQIGNLKDRPLKCVTSPPYEDSDVDGARKMAAGYFDQVGGIRHTKTVDANSEGQIGQERNESYLDAMLQVYSEAIKVADVLVVVTKNPTRSGKLRRLDLDTLAILQQANWTIHCQHQARLFEEQEHTDLFGETQKKAKGRLSFFKRLSYEKGSEVADHEDIVVAIRSPKVLPKTP